MYIGYFGGIPFNFGLSFVQRTRVVQMREIYEMKAYDRTNIVVFFKSNATVVWPSTQLDTGEEGFDSFSLYYTYNAYRVD